MHCKTENAQTITSFLSNESVHGVYVRVDNTHIEYKAGRE